MGEFVRTETDGAVATIRIDRPPANALARPVSLELSDAAGAVADDDAIGAVVVWGGETIFAAGADIKAMVGYGPDEIASDVGALEQACRDLEAIPKITIAAINGFALGGGWSWPWPATSGTRPKTPSSACPRSTWGSSLARAGPRGSRASWVSPGPAT